MGTPLRLETPLTLPRKPAAIRATSIIRTRPPLRPVPLRVIPTSCAEPSDADRALWPSVASIEPATADETSGSDRETSADIRGGARRRAASPRRDMPRERMLAVGAGALSDVELIALVLGSGLRGHNVFDVANSLLERFQSLRAMLGATPAQFDGLRGVGRAKTAQLLAIVELSRRALAEEREERALMDSPETAEDYPRLQIRTRPHEVFACLFLEARHRLMRYEETSRGSLTQMAVYPREIVRQALSINAAGLIVAHNHPSGAVKPSASDRQLTRGLRDALALTDVQFIDHLASARVTSIRSRARVGPAATARNGPGAITRARQHPQIFGLIFRLFFC